jgi:hypothetical protein
VDRRGLGGRGFFCKSVWAIISWLAWHEWSKAFRNMDIRAEGQLTAYINIHRHACRCQITGDIRHYPDIVQWRK